MFWNALYQALWCIAPPLLRRYLKKRARLAPAYAEHWNERFGQPYPQPVQNAVWIHAVSVGETRAAAPLIAALSEYFPDAPLLITQTTPTGRSTAQSLYPQAQCRYLPYDKADYVRRFLSEHRPRLGILMETEIWPNLLHEAHRRHIPVFLANARLSERSQKGYLKAAGLIRPAVATLSGCLAQTERDAKRLRGIGARSVHICGNTKYDITLPESARLQAAAFKKQIGSRPVIVCASTRTHREEDEAALLLDAWRRHTAQHAENALLVVVPRHPERFQAAADTAAALGLRVQKRSSGEAVSPDTQVWVGDSMGELFAYYLCADIAFVGGSLVDTGCQNLIEPIACGVPTIVGFSTYNFAAAAEEACRCGAAVQVQSAAEWAQKSSELLEHADERARMAAQAEGFIQRNRGAGKRMAAAIAEHVRSTTITTG